MKPWVQIDEAPVPASSAVMHLLRRDQELVIRVDGQTLMSSRMHGSEDALAFAALEQLAAQWPSVLIGGLGMGFTAKAALDALPERGEVVVIELVSAVVRWNEGVIGDATGRPLDDPRVDVRVGDIGQSIRADANRWDAILLDVDNGPESLSHPDNAWLYGAKGLKSALQALRDGGILGVWSAGDDDGFTQRLARTGFQVEVRRVRARGNQKGARHTIWLAKKPEGRG